MLHWRCCLRVPRVGWNWIPCNIKVPKAREIKTIHTTLGVLGDQTREGCCHLEVPKEG